MEDPLSGLSFLPRSLLSLSNPPQLSNTQDLHHCHDFLKSMSSQNPNKSLKEAKTISELVNSKMASNVASENSNESVKPVANVEPQEGGMGLSHKRSWEDANPEPTFDGSKYEDPESLFTAFEAFQKERSEWNNQAGGGAGMEANQTHISRRPRRSGILGREQTKYRHVGFDAGQSVKANANINSQGRGTGLDRKQVCFDASQAPTFDVAKYKDPESLFAEFRKYRNAKKEWDKQTGAATVEKDQTKRLSRARRPGIPGRKPPDYKHLFPSLLSPPNESMSKEITDANPEPTFDGSKYEDPESLFTAFEAFQKERSEWNNQAGGGAGMEANQTHISRRPRRSGIPGEQTKYRDVGFDAGQSVKANTNINSQGRGTDLDRKQVCFDASQAPTIDVAKYKDPESLFAEVRKFRNAKKEWDKQTGAATVEKDRTKRLSRARRPGIPGRKPPDYKHLFSTRTQETFVEDIISPPNESMSKEITDATGQRREPVDSITETENSVSELMDELFARGHEELDGGGVMTLIQDRLQIKPFQLDDLCLPDMPDVQRIDVNASKAGRINTRTALSDIHNTLNKINGKASGGISLAPKESKSPFHSLHLLEKQVSHSDRLTGSFSWHDDIDNPLAGNASTGTNARSTSHNVDETADAEACPFDSALKENASCAFTCKLKSLLSEENDNTVDDACPSNVDVGDTVSASDKSANIDSTGLDSAVGVSTGGSREMAGSDGAVLMGNGEKQDVLQGCATSLDMQTSNQLSGKDESARMLVKKQRKQASQKYKTRESVAFSRRKSLAAAGTSMISGVRRSTRITSKPLKFWEGEKFLYGRVHESLTTVIGIRKLETHGTNKHKPSLTVESFVSDEFKEVLDLAAQH